MSPCGVSLKNVQTARGGDVPRGCSCDNEQTRDTGLCQREIAVAVTVISCLHAQNNLIIYITVFDVNSAVRETVMWSIVPMT